MTKSRYMREVDVASRSAFADMVAKRGSIRLRSIQIQVRIMTRDTNHKDKDRLQQGWLTQPSRMQQAIMLRGI